MMRAMRWFAFAWLLALASFACKRSAVKSDESAMKPLVVKESSQGLLFTWVDENGKFGTEQSAKDVPEKNREVVRVRDPGQDEDGEHITLADLRAPAADGTYPTRVALRSEFDDLVRTRRAKVGKTLETTIATATTAAPAGTAGTSAPTSGQPQVIIYGASWCGACHEAAAWMKRKGIAYVEKDIEADSSAEREMKVKLARIGKRGGSIPVIDVKGQIFVGFSAPAIERALRG